MFRLRIAQFVWVITLFSSLFVSTPLKASVLFQKPLKMQGTINVPFNQNMVDLLVDKGVPPYRFFSTDLPSWLKIQNDNLVGTPPATGDWNFHLSVRDSTPEGVDFNEPTTLTVLPPPPQFVTSDIDLGTQKEDSAWSDNVKNYLVNASLATSFEATGLPGWMTFDPSTGKLSGTPRRVDVGAYQGIKFTARGLGGTAVASAHGNVLKTIHPPKWKSPSNSFSDGLEDQPFLNETMPLISKGDGVEFRFSMNGAPTWLQIDSSSGALSGTPHTFGNYSFSITLESTIDGNNFTDTANFSFKIIHVNHPPIWSQNPIRLPDSFTAVSYTQTIQAFASDPDVGDKLTFSLTGPAWGKIDPATGAISGTPAKSDIGLNTWTAVVTDPSGASASTTVEIKVIKSNEPPQWLAKPTLLSDAKEDFSYSVSLVASASDPDNDPMFFTIVSGPKWATLSEQGQFEGIPGASDVGLNTFQIRVSDHKSSPDDVAEVKIFVGHTNHAPVWTLNPILSSTNEDSPFSTNVSPFAKDVDPGDTLTFTLLEGPSWGVLSDKGIFSGTPFMANEGANTFKLRVTDNSGLFADTTMVVTVLHVNHPPVWSQNPIKLPNANDDAVYSASIANYASDVDPGDILHFTKIETAPKWLTLDDQGNISASPTPADVGTYTFTAQVADTAGAKATTTVSITVDHINHAPRWTQNPINLPQAFTWVNYNQTIAALAVDPDAGDTLTFSMTGPSWASLDPKTGKFSGNPQKADIGPNTFQAVVTDNLGLSATTTITLTVIKSNEPPKWTTKPTFLVDAHEDSAYSVALSAFASDPDNDPLFFTLISGPSWAKVDTNGNIVGTPKAKDVGQNKFQIKVSDHLSTPDDISEVVVVVVHTNHAPYWTTNPIQSSTNEDAAFSLALAPFAADPDLGDTLAFSLVSGPAWATLSATGVLTGTPHQAEIGANEFSVRVADNSGLTADAKVVVTVIHVNHPPVWTQNPIVLANAKDDSPYASSISEFAVDVDPGDVLRFSKIDAAPSWLSVDATGKIVANPTPKDVGTYSFRAQVTDSANASAVATVKITVDHVNHAPQWSQNPIELPSALTAVAYSQSVSSFASDPDVGDVLTFSMTGPSWAKLNPKTGVFSGTPTKADLGSNVFQATITDPSGASATTTINVKVIKSNEPPQWTQHPTILPNASEDGNVSIDLKAYATDPDSDPLFFTIVSGPSWASIDANGNLVGSPKASNLGLNKFQIRVSDHIALPDDVSEVQISVEHVNHPPTWTQNPIVLPNGFSGVAYTQGVATYAKDSDVGDILTFSMQGPAWASIDPATGKIVGTPSKADVGAHEWQAMVKDSSGASAITTVKVTVVKSNEPPQWTQHPTLLEDGKEDGAYSVVLSNYASDPDADPMFFTKIDGPAWGTIDSSGRLVGTPRVSDVGLNKFHLKVSDHITLPDDTSEIQVLVIHVNHAPYWVMNPMLFSTTEEKPFTTNLAGVAKDPDPNDKLTFSLVSGPSWATLSTDGVFGGTPQVADEGVNSFTVSVADLSGATATATLMVTVLHQNHAPYWTQNPIVLPNVNDGTPYVSSVTEYAKDSDPNEKLTFSKVSSTPTWVKIDSTGRVFGTPTYANLGLNSFEVKVTDAGGLSANATVQITVNHENRPPKWTANPILLPQATSQSLYTKPLASYVTDPDPNESFQFQMTGPAWATLDPKTGVFSGTPSNADVGENTWQATVTDAAGASDTTVIKIDVKKVNEPPKWLAHPTLLPEGKEDAAYFFDLKTSASDPDGDPIFITKVDGPAWATLASDGTLKGVPGAGDVGLNKFHFTVSDHIASPDDTTEVQIFIVHTNHAPYWVMNPILFSAKESEPWNANVGVYAKDPDANDLLSFTLVSGPDWAQLSPDGNFNGTPSSANLGANHFVVRVSDSAGLFADTAVTVTVKSVDHPPVIGSDLPKFVVKERETRTENLTRWVTDPDGDPLVFTLQDTKPWIVLSPQGVMTLTPKRPDLGDYQLRFTVAAGALSAQGILHIEVVKDPQPPQWNTHPIAILDGKVNETFSASVRDRASDPNGEALTFSKKSGSAWLSMSAGAELLGIPRDADIGKNEFTLSVCNEDQLCADGLLVVNVKTGTPVVDIVQVDSPVVGASSENIWVVDVAGCSNIVAALKKHIGVLYSDLKEAQIHHSGVYLSTDPHTYDGHPIYQNQSEPLLLWNNANIVTDFRKRTDSISYRTGSLRCGHCKNSPLWSLHRFYQQEPTFSSLWHGEYMNADVPMDAMIVSEHKDQYKYYAQKFPVESQWTPVDYADSFTEFHRAKSKTYRMNVITTACETRENAQADGAYQTVVDRTAGKLYAVSNCNVDMPKILHDYAQRMIQRAYIHAKHRIPLSKTPRTPSEIKVYLAGTLLTGNTGASTDLWNYDGGRNEVVLHWNLIGDAHLKPGDKLSIEYYADSERLSQLLRF